MARNRATWALQDAETRLSEVIRKVKTEGPQRITIDGCEEVVVVTIEEHQPATSGRTGAELVAVLNDSPLKEIDLDLPRPRVRARPPVKL